MSRMCMVRNSLRWLLFFFFSSRRLHTRYWRDWSSGVCSSDLVRGGAPAGYRPGVRRPRARVRRRPVRSRVGHRKPLEEDQWRKYVRKTAGGPGTRSSARVARAGAGRVLRRLKLCPSQNVEPKGAEMTDADPQAGYAPVNGLEMYYEVHGTGQPLVVLHGAYMTIGTMGEVV